MNKIIKIIFNNIGLICSFSLLKADSYFLVLIGIGGISVTTVNNILWIMGYESRRKNTKEKTKND